MSQSHDRPNSKVKILLVDDQPANLTVLKTVIDGLNVSLVEAHSGEEALRRLLEDEFAVVLLDVQMPGVDGFETAKLIRGRENSLHTPIIFQTAYDTDRVTVEKAYELGAVDFLVKPLMPVVLRSKVMGFVELFQQRKQNKRQAEQLRQVERREFQHKLAEENARFQEQREWLRVTLTSIGDAVITTDPEGRVTFLNPVAESMTGWMQEQAVGRPLAEVFPIVHETSRKPVDDPVAKVIRQGSVVGLGNHTILIAKDGTERPIDDSAAPIKDAQGRILGVVLVFRDVTERRQLERLQRDLQAELERQVQERTIELRASEERFRLLVEGTKEYALFLLDPSGHVASWNPGAARIKGYQADEIIGQHFSRFYPPEDVQAGKPGRELEIARSEGKYEEEGWRVRKDGTRFWASVVITALPDETGRARGFSKVTRDITERKQAEENARRLLQEEAARRAAEQYAQVIEAQREQLRVTLTSIGDAVITTDDEGRVTLLNPIAEALTGWTGKDAAGQPLDTVFRIINEMSRQTVENPVAKVLTTGHIVGLANHTVLIAKDGTERPIDDSAAPIRDQDGRVAGVVLVFRDITARKRDEKERRKRVEQLAGAEAALREAARRKDEFLATLAHELRNPLAPIRNSLQLLRLAKGNGEMMDQACSMMERQVQHLVRLIDDLLEISRITSGKLQVRKERVELAAVVQSAEEASRPFVQAKSHELTVTLPPEPIYLDADPTRLAQIISNLLNNAAKYTEKGGHIWLTAERHGGEALVSVRDTGIGIAAEHLPHIFEMFSQVAPALERSEGGLGIGLSLVRGLLDLHGGTIEAHSSPGKGSEFIVHLPVVEGLMQAPSDGTAHTKPARSGPKFRILVVDDNRDAADSLAMMLRLMGHEVQTAHDGVEGVQAAATFRPDVALLDIGMPKMNGYEVARHIREQPWGKELLLVALTGWTQEEDKMRATKAGFHYHLTKPVEPAAIVKVLECIPKPRK